MNDTEKVPVSLTFNDIALVPMEMSETSSRRSDELMLGAQISKNIFLNLPVVASYMDSVCEAPMAIEMARLGGIGVIHRLMTIEDQVKHVRAVKRAESRIIKEPYTILPGTPVPEIQRKFLELGVGTFLVANGNNKLLGVVSTRDVDLREDETLAASDVMTPREKVITGPPDITSEQAVELFIKYRLENIPLVNKNDTVKGLVSKKDLKKLSNTLASRGPDGHLLVGAGIGLDKNYMARTEALVEAGADWIVLAVANGYLQITVEAVQRIRAKFPEIDLAVGCTTEYHGTKRLFRAGADTVLVGIGPGSICETRKKTGVGVGQFTALRWAQQAAREEGKYILNDGGIREPNHLVKALFAGASGVILGNVLAGTDKSPGEVMRVGDRLVKFHRGLASEDAKNKLDALNQKSREVSREDYWEYVYKHVGAEGVESGFVPYTGTTVDAVRYIIQGLRSAMTYMNAKNINDLWETCNRRQYVRTTDAVYREGNPHDLLGFRS